MCKAFLLGGCLSLFACGSSGKSADGGAGGAPGGSTLPCAVGLEVKGAANASFSVNEDALCLFSRDSTASLDTRIQPNADAQWIEIHVGNLAEGQTGSGFPAGVAVIFLDGSVYQTSTSGCTARITEHSLTSTEMGATGEERYYQIGGTASCSEAAVSTRDASATATLSGLSFRTPAVWRD